MRIATVLLNILHLIFSTLLEMCEVFQSFQVSEPHLLYFMAVIFSGLGVFGALNFHLIAVFVSTLGLAVLFILYLAEAHLFGLMILICILLCHICFIYEMRRGIMTRENYANAEYIQDEGREVLETVHSYASEIGETTKDVANEVAQEVHRSASTAFTLPTDTPRKTEEC